MSIITNARSLRSIIEQVSSHLDDKTASTAVVLLPKLKSNGSLVPAGTRINWNNSIKRAAVDLWDTDANNPDNAPSLWEDISYKEGYRIIPEVITVGTAFTLGERGWWDEVLYESLIEANVYTPTAYPAGWKVVK